MQNRRIGGFRGIELLRREVGDEVESVTITGFESLDAVVAFAGDDCEVAVAPGSARVVLSHFDERAQRCEIRAERLADPSH